MNFFRQKNVALSKQDAKKANANGKEKFELETGWL